METKRCNQSLASDPLADEILETIHGHRKFQLMMDTIEMGIFDDLETSVEPVTAEKLAKKRGFNVESLTKFLDALCSVNLIGKTTNARGKSLYHNTAGGSKYLTRSRKPSLVPVAMMEQKMVGPILDKLPTLLEIDNGKKMDIMSKSNGVDSSKLIQPPPNMVQHNNNTNKPPPGGMNGLEMQMKFLMCMDGFAAPCAPALAKAFDLSSCTTAVDLGGGSGAIGIAMANAYKSMEVKILDLPNVVHVAKKLKGNLPDNASFCIGNFFEDALPSADLYILAHVIHDWDDDHVAQLLNKVHGAMPAGSSLLVLEKMLDNKKDGPQMAATDNLIMSMITKGRERTEQEYRSLLSNHGFVATATKRIHGFNTYDAILTKKPY